MPPLPVPYFEKMIMLSASIALCTAYILNLQEASDSAGDCRARPYMQAKPDLPGKILLYLYSTV